MTTDHLPESQYLAGEREAEQRVDAEALEAIRESEAADELRHRVEALKSELPCLSMGYIGNYERWGDCTSHYIFLPHSYRVGEYRDMVSIGNGTDKTKFRKTLANWAKVEQAIRRQYASDPNRIEHLTLRNGRLVESDGRLSKYAPRTQYNAPLFETVAEANAWLAVYNYPSVVVETVKVGA